MSTNDTSRDVPSLTRLDELNNNRARGLDPGLQAAIGSSVAKGMND
jgi:hypothetical protein